MKSLVSVSIGSIVLVLILAAMKGCAPLQPDGNMQPQPVPVLSANFNIDGNNFEILEFEYNGNHYTILKSIYDNNCVLLDKYSTAK